jgi:hypothetical protein
MSQVLRDVPRRDVSNHSGTFWTRPRGPLLLGAAACAACCAPPVFAVLLGAGTATTAAVLEPIAGILMASSAVLVIVLVVKRWRAARCSANACAVDRSCGCGPANDTTIYASPKPAPDAPIARTHDLSDRRAVQEHIDDYRVAFKHLVGIERADDGFIWRFDARRGWTSGWRSSPCASTPGAAL